MKERSYVGGTDHAETIYFLNGSPHFDGPTSDFARVFKKNEVNW